MLQSQQLLAVLFEYDNFQLLLLCKIKQKKSLLGSKNGTVYIMDEQWHASCTLISHSTGAYHTTLHACSGCLSLNQKHQNLRHSNGIGKGNYNDQLTYSCGSLNFGHRWLLLVGVKLLDLLKINKIERK